MKSPKLYHCHTRHWWKTSLSSLPGMGPLRNLCWCSHLQVHICSEGGLAALQHVLLGGR